MEKINEERSSSSENNSIFLKNADFSCLVNGSNCYMGYIENEHGSQTKCYKMKPISLVPVMSPRRSLAVWTNDKARHS